jgi:hypothetical protein
MKILSSSQQLYEYLLSLAAELDRCGSTELSQAVRSASRHAAGMSTEFLGESRFALRRVLEQENGLLKEHDRADLLDVLKQLDHALDTR